MGVTLKRIAFAALVAAAALLPFRKSHDTGDSVITADRTERLTTASIAYRQAHMSWTAFDLRDSAAAIAAMAKPGTAPDVQWRGFPSGSIKASHDTILANLWAGLGIPDSNVTVSVMFFNISAYKQPVYSGVYIVRHGNRIDCVAIIPQYVPPTGKADLWNSPADGLASLSPCALLAAFGVPGDSVASWTTATRYSLAGSNKWFAPEKRMRFYERGPWMQWYGADMDQEIPDFLFGPLGSTGIAEMVMSMRPPYAYGSAGLRCIAGESALCVKGVLHAGRRAPDTTVMPVELTLDQQFTMPTNVTLSTVRPPSGIILSNMITEFGRERFKKFWTSNKPVEAAFLDAFGVSLATWSARWAKASWDETWNAKHVNPEVLLGVTLKPSSLPVLLGWTALMLLIAAAVARRRTA